MDLMNFNDRKKSYKLQIFVFLIFILSGVGLIVYALNGSSEATTIIGQNVVAIYEESSYLKDVEDDEPDNIVGECIIALNNDVIRNDDNALCSSMTLPVISVNYEEMTDLNLEIKTMFEENYNNYKNTMKNAENNFTYKVTYKYYENSFEDKNILSVTLYERIIDEENDADVIEKIHAYNIDLATLEVLKQVDMAEYILGSEYKQIIKEAISTYVEDNNLVNEDFHYSYTNLEKFYIRDNIFRLLFDPDELVDKVHGIINIKIEV